LTISHGEHISEFYSRAQELAREIDIANLPDGNSANLLYQFLLQLRRTADPTILGITNTYWSQITIFRRNPSHFTAVKLPWELHDLFSELEASDISILSLPGMSDTNGRSSNFAIEDYSNNNITPPIPAPFAAYSGAPSRMFVDNNNSTPAIPDSYNNNNIQSMLVPIAAYGGSHPRYNNNTNNNNNSKHAGSHHKEVSVHHTRDGRRYISDNSSKIACNLCFNKHPNPWHTANNCPFKHPTHIIEKAVRERVMQHNALHGAENQDYSKNQDSPSKPHAPPTSATANRALFCDTKTNIISPSPLRHSDQSILQDTLLVDLPIDSADEIVHTDIFQVPVIPTANMGQSPSLQEDFSLDDLIFDPNHYLSYNS
jgi:hypothetical protein